jgi:redox-regulated HSP33 family molecular chaperone
MNPKGGTSTAVNLTVSASISSLSPSSKVAGEPAFTLTVNGAGFVNGSVVRFNGADRTTTLVNSTQLTAQIPPTDIQSAGTKAVTVVNPVGGGSYNSSSIVRFNGSDRATTLVGGTQLTAQITAADIGVAGNYAITVFNPTPGGGSSNATDLTVNNPAPTLSGISPTSKTTGEAALTLMVNGAGFVNGAVVRLNDSDRTTTFVDAMQLTAQITAADMATAGTFAVSVFNPAPGGGSSSSVDFTVNNPLPTVSSISPTGRTAGDAAFTLTVNGRGFVNGAVVRFNGSDRTTTFVDSTQLTAEISAADVAAAGNYAVTVFNPTPGGGSSNATELTVNNPVPMVSSISPASKTVGEGAFTLTVNGSNFNSNSIVQFNGSDRATTFVDAAQLTADITAADVAEAGTFSITVLNPVPGGGISSSVDLTVINPVPIVSTLAPDRILEGSAGFPLMHPQNALLPIWDRAIMTFNDADHFPQNSPVVLGKA